jgi:outer membrane protein assembly complex protein YaeT
VALDLGHSAFVELFGGDHADFVCACEIEIIFAVDLTAEAYLQDAAVCKEAFFEGAAEWCAVRILTAEIFIPEIVVGVELDKVDGPAVFFGDGAQDREADGVVAADAGGAGSGGEDRYDALLDATEGVFDGQRIDREVAKVCDAVFFERIEFQDGIPRPNDCRLYSHVARAETRTGAIGGAAVKRDADDGDVQFFRFRDVRETHKGGYAGEARVLEGVNGFRMRQTKDASGLGHEVRILVSENGRSQRDVDTRPLLWIGCPPEQDRGADNPAMPTAICGASSRPPWCRGEMSRRQVMVTTVVVSLLAGTTLAAHNENPPRDAELVRSQVQKAGAAIVDEIVFAGLRRISPETVKTQIASRVGERFDEQQITRDVRNLARLGWFVAIRVNVERVEPVAEVPAVSPQHVRLEFDLPENPYLVEVQYSGSRLLSPRQIENLLADRKLAPKLGEPENPVQLHQIAGALKAALADLGHPEARVEVCRTQTANATVRVRFEIADGPRHVVGRVSFNGDPQVPAKTLRGQTRQIHPGGPFAGLARKNAYTREAFEEDRERLLAYYQNHGYPEARIGGAVVSKYEDRPRGWIPWPRKATRVRFAVGIPIEAGPLYRVESVRVAEGLGSGKTARNKSLAALNESLSGQPYSAREIENLRRSWQARIPPKADRESASFYNVDAVPTLDSDAHTVRIVLDRSLTPPYVVRRLEFVGIHRFPDRYFRSRILLTEGAPFDDRLLEAGLARLARTGYFKPIKKQDVHVETNEAARTADVTIRIEELGQQRAFLTGGHGQFGSTLGVAYTVLNLLDREELLSSRIEGGPESLQLAIGFAKQGFLGSRGALALSAFNTFLRPHLTGSVRGPFFRQESAGLDATYTCTLTNSNSLSVQLDLSRSKTRYSSAQPAGVTGPTVSNASAETSSHSAGLGWTHDTGDERMVLVNSVSGGWLGGGENLVRSKLEYGRIAPDRIFNRANSWAFRTTFTGAGSYSGEMPFYTRVFAGDDLVRGLRAGELGPEAVIDSISPAGATKYSATPAGANLLGAANAEYRSKLSDNTEAAGFFDLGSGALLMNWLGAARPTLANSTNSNPHASAGVELRWTLPGVGVPVRVYYAVNVLRLDRWLPMPDGSLFHARNRFSAFGWALGSLF